MSVAAARDETDLGASAEAAPKRILFVDDKPDTFKDLQERLGADGAEWQVERAPGGEEALAALEHAPVDVLVAQDQMAAMDGVTLLTRVRDQHPTTIRMIVRPRFLARPLPGPRDAGGEDHRLDPLGWARPARGDHGSIAARHRQVGARL